MGAFFVGILMISWGNEPAYTVYSVNGEQVGKETYEQASSRFVFPIDENFKLY